jgi:hypothetical protein
MIDLADLQRRFQAALLEGDAVTLALELHDRAAERIAIYQDAYRVRLREALAGNYPQLKKLLGADAFDSIADTFIDAHRATHPSIRWFGSELSALLSASFPMQPWLGELAKWEWALNSAFDARDAVPIDASHLAGYPPEDWPNLCFEFHSSVQCLLFRTNAPQLYKTLTEQRSAPSPTLTQMSSWLIWRGDLLLPRYRVLDAAEADALRAVLDGGTFATLCTTLCTHLPLDEVAARAVALLQQWLEAHTITGVRATAVGAPPQAGA